MAAEIVGLLELSSRNTWAARHSGVVGSGLLLAIVVSINMQGAAAARPPILAQSPFS
jgi:hypothetical protein